jgi:hypothetical protein
MAVYQGARLRTESLPAREVAGRHPRAAAPRSSGAASRMRPMGLLMAVIVATTVLGLVYLTQTLGSSATSTEIWRLERQAGDLYKDTRTLQIGVMRAAEPDAIISKAKKKTFNLKRLDDLVVLPAP